MRKKVSIFIVGLLAITLCSCVQREVEYVSSESLADATIGVAMGSVHDTYVSENFTQASIQRTESMVELPLLLSGGRVDYIILDENVAKSMLRQYPELEVVEDRLFVSDIAAGFSYDNPKLCEEFNQFMTHFKESDTYADIVKRWHVDGGGGDIPHIDEVTGGKRIRAGVSSLIPPFCMVRNNKLEGSSIEIAKHFALEYGYTLELLDINITGLLSSIQTNRVDLLIPGLIYTKERAESILHSNTYLHSASKVIARKSSTKQESTDDSNYSTEILSQSRIVVLTGSTSDIYAEENFPDAKIVRVDNMADFYPMLKNDQADFLIADVPQMEEIQRNYPEFVIAEDNLYAIGVAVLMPNSQEALRKEFNEFLKEFIPSKEFKDLYERWITEGDTSNIPYVESVESSRKLVIATDPNNYPYNTIVDGRLTGFEIEMMRHFALSRGIELEFIQMNFSALVSAIASDKVDAAVCLVCATEERKRSFLFSDEYTSVASGVGYIGKEKKLFKDYTTPQITSSTPGEAPNVNDTVRCYVQKGVVSAVEGTIQEQYISSILPSSQVAIVKDYADGVLSLVSGSSDYMITNLGTARSFQKSQESLEIVLQDFFSFDTRYGISKERSELKRELNAFLSRLRDDGTLKKLSNKWLTDIEDAEFEKIEYDPNAPVLRVGSSCTAVPFSFVLNGSVVGLDIEVISLFCKDAGYRLEIVKMPFGSLVSAISTGKVDLIANTLSATPERLEKIDFSDPYGYNCFALLYSREAINDSGNDAGNSVGFFESIKISFIRNIITEERYKMILDGVWVTIIISILSIIFGTLIGAIVCSMTMSHSAVTKWFGELYVTIIRGTPVLVILMINFYVIFAKTPISPIWVATISFAMNFGAYVSEMFRSSIISIDRGQREAGLAMGFSDVKTFIFIIAPQAIKRVMPVFKGEAISLVKMTSIVGYIAVQDITKVGDIIRSRTFDAFFPLLVSALLYFLIAYLFSVLLDILTSKITHTK
ncbi:MAG: ABC transporter permease subunit [Rikenellaceae bacterium]